MAVPAKLQDPVLAAKASASPRVFLRGEEYHAAGAVLSVKEVGPGRAVAHVAGTQEQPYLVKLRFGGEGFSAECSCPFDWEPVCKHAVAACLALKAPQPVEHQAAAQDSAIAKARANELEQRRASAKSTRFRIVASPGRGREHFTLRSPRTEAIYEVFLSREASFCTCADFTSSELGTCKHILFLSKEPEAQRPLDKPVVFIQSVDTRGRVHAPLRDIRAIFPEDAPRAAFAAVLDGEGFLDPESRLLKDLATHQAARKVEKLLSTLPRGAGVRPEVLGLLRGLQQKGARQERMRTFCQGVRRSHSGVEAPPEAWARMSEALKLRLHAYQQEGVLFAATAGRALIADDMGLGKTLQALAAGRLLAELGEVKRTLVVCPASLKFQWAKEAEKAFGKEVPVVVVDGGRKTRRRLYLSSDGAVLVVNYELLIRDIKELRAGRFDLVVLDEAQRIKNWNTRTAKAVKALRTPFAFVLTGTPLENRLSELHSIAEYLDPRVLGPSWRLVPEFGQLDAKGKLLGFGGLSLIRRRLSPTFIRRERSSVLSQLPPRSEKTYLVPFTATQKAPHDDCLAQVARILVKKYLTEADVLRVMSLLTTARMLANGMALYEFATIEDEVRRGNFPERTAKAFPSPKLAEFAQALEDFLDEPGCKVVVFSQWERMLRLAAAAARPVMEAKKVRPLFFHGGLSSRERAEAIADFHDDPLARVFFSTDAGGVGLNLQEAASVVFHLEVPWNPAVLEQRVGRVHRMGQRRPVRVVNFVSAESIEERISLTVQHKRELFDGLFRGTSDEIAFGDGTGASGLRERLKALMGKGASASLGELRQPVDKPVPVPPPMVPPEVVEPEVVHRPMAPPEVSASRAPADLSSGDATSLKSTAAGLVFDAAPLFSGLLAMVAPAAASILPDRLPVTVSREGGRVRLELPEVPAGAWQKLAAFAEAMSRRAG
ncbi:MAG: DEAD/DEAH box helicase [Myxococcales bacterium]|nr:DEAD/DEAH box helicase [Myxococcales bacterium]